jgi:LacI family transcriptional regulator
MRDVAERAGVSFKTVSRVINDEGGVSPDLAGRVEDAVDALGYRPDEHARRLRQGGTRTGAIGFVIVDVANPFFSSVLRGIEEVARAHDSIVMSGSTDGDKDRENQLIGAFTSRRVDGLIVVPEGSSNGALRTEVERGTPVVFVDLEPHDLTADLVRSDHLNGSIVATEHLIDHGHRDIAFFGDFPEISSSRLRRAGYEQALSAVGIAVEERRIVQDRLRPAEWRELIRNYLQEPDPPTAIFSAQNFVTVGCTEALHDLGLHERIAQVGFDDVELGDVIVPGITTVPQQPLDLGHRAAEILFARIAGERSSPTKAILTCTITERGSGEIRPTDPPTSDRPT